MRQPARPRETIGGRQARPRACAARCLGEGLRITQRMTLMAIGLCNPPEGMWLPSVIY
jgi:hypothetical protein